MFLTRHHVFFLTAAAALIGAVARSALAQVSPSNPKTSPYAPDGGSASARDAAVMSIRASAMFTVTGKTRAIKDEERAFFAVATVGS